MLKKMWHLCGDFKGQIMVIFVFQRKSGGSSVLLTIRPWEARTERTVRREWCFGFGPTGLGADLLFGGTREARVWQLYWAIRRAVVVLFHRGETTGWRDDGFVFRCVAFETFALLFRIGFPLDYIFLKYFFTFMIVKSKLVKSTKPTYSWKWSVWIPIKSTY